MNRCLVINGCTDRCSMQSRAQWRGPFAERSRYLPARPRMVDGVRFVIGSWYVCWYNLSAGMVPRTGRARTCLVFEQSRHHTHSPRVNIVSRHLSAYKHPSIDWTKQAANISNKNRTKGSEMLTDAIRARLQPSSSATASKSLSSNRCTTRNLTNLSGRHSTNVTSCKYTYSLGYSPTVTATYSSNVSPTTSRTRSLPRSLTWRPRTGPRRGQSATWTLLRCESASEHPSRLIAHPSIMCVSLRQQMSPPSPYRARAGRCPRSRDKPSSAQCCRQQRKPAPAARSFFRVVSLPTSRGRKAPVGPQLGRSRNLCVSSSRPRHGIPAKWARRGLIWDEMHVLARIRVRGRDAA